MKVKAPTAILMAIFFLCTPLFIFISNNPGLEFMEKNGWAPFILAPILSIIFTKVTQGVDLKAPAFWGWFGVSTLVALVEAALIVFTN